MDNHNPLLNQGFHILGRISFLRRFRLRHHRNMLCIWRLDGRGIGWPLRSLRWFLMLPRRLNLCVGRSCRIRRPLVKLDCHGTILLLRFVSNSWKSSHELRRPWNYGILGSSLLCSRTLLDLAFWYKYLNLDINI